MILITQSSPPRRMLSSISTSTGLPKNRLQVYLSWDLVHSHSMSAFLEIPLEIGHVHSAFPRWRMMPSSASSMENGNVSLMKATYSERVWQSEAFSPSFLRASSAPDLAAHPLPQASMTSIDI